MNSLAYRPNAINQDWERLQAQDDLETQFSELVDGSMRTSFELQFDDQDLYGHDGRSMTGVGREALIDAKRTARTRPELWFEVRRRSIEVEEVALACKMAAGEGPNTMIIPSDFPAELMDVSEDVGGYNVTRKQTMLRVLTRLPNGNVRLYSQSLDSSDRTALEAIYAHFGITPEPGELLGQRIHVNLAAEDQATIIDSLTGVYDRSMITRYGGEWYAGRRPADYRNTYDFVRQQEDLIQTCVDLKLDGLLTDQILYNMSATMRKRFKTGTTTMTQVVSSVIRQEIIDPNMLWNEINSNGQDARREGLSFSACGATLAAEVTENSLQTKLKEAGYGNKTDSNADCEYISKSCPSCGTKNVKTWDKKIAGNKRRISGSCGCSKDYIKH